MNAGRVGCASLIAVCAHLHRNAHVSEHLSVSCTKQVQFAGHKLSHMCACLQCIAVHLQLPYMASIMSICQSQGHEKPYPLSILSITVNHRGAEAIC